MSAPDPPKIRRARPERSRSDGWTPERRLRFLDALASTGSVARAAAAAGSLIGGGSWGFELSHLADGALYEVISMLGALALGLLLMHSALAIVTYFVLPTVVGIVVELVSALEEPSKWFDPNQTTPPLAEGTIAGDGWSKLAVTVVIWVVLPLVLGLVRLHRHELK